MNAWIRGTRRVEEKLDERHVMTDVAWIHGYMDTWVDARRVHT
jgi:hypothetical protein